MTVDGYIVNINYCHVHCKFYEATRPISMRSSPDDMRPRPERVRPRLRPRPNDLASRPHEPRGLNI